MHIDFSDPVEVLRFDIASHEEDIRGWEETIAANQAEIPKLERETLEKQRDVAVAKLKVIELRAVLAARTEL